MAAVDDDFDVQPVIDEQERRRRGRVAAKTRELIVGLQRRGVAALQFDRELAADNAVGDDVGVAAGGERYGSVEEGLGLCDHLVATRLAKALAALARIVGDRIGAVERVVKTAPAGVCSIQRIACIGEWHHELWSANLADFLVDVGGLDLVGRRIRQEIANLFQESRIGANVERLAFVGPMPVVDFRLQAVTDGEQLAIFRCQIAYDGGKPGPERIGSDPGFRRSLLADEIKQDGRNLQSVGIDTIHDRFFSQETAPKNAIFGNFRSKKRAKRREVSGAF